MATDAQSNTVEIIFDRAIDIGVQANVSGTAVIFENGTQRATTPLSYSASSRVSMKITVPAGTFQTARWEVVFKLGPLETHMSAYTVGLTDIQLDYKAYASGSLIRTTS